MRVTDSMFFVQSRQQLGQARARMLEAQEQATTGIRVGTPGADPLAYSEARGERSREVTADGHERITNAAVALLNLTDATLDSMGEIMRTMREKAVQAANDTYSAADRSGMAVEVTRAREAMIALANTQQNGSYIFAGFTDDQPAVDATGAYLGDGAVRQVQVEAGTRMAVGVSAHGILGVGVGTDILAVMQDFSTALAANDTVGIQTAIDTMNAGHRQLVAARSQVGAQTDGFLIMQSIAQRTSDQAGIRQTDLVGIDPIDAYSRYQQAQQALSEAIEIASKLPMPSLLTR